MWSISYTDICVLTTSESETNPHKMIVNVDTTVTVESTTFWNNVMLSRVEPFNIVYNTSFMHVIVVIEAVLWWWHNNRKGWRAGWGKLACDRENSK